MAIDWGTVFGGVVDIANTYGQMTSGQLTSGFSSPTVALPSPVTAATPAATGLPAGMYIDKHGHLVHRRRRRRPCITQTDLSLAWQISNLPNNANVKMFLAKCVR